MGVSLAMSLRHRLRSDTASLHRRIDGLFVQRRWFESPQGYGRWLNGMLAFHVGVHAALSDFSASSPAQAARVRRLGLDMMDLQVVPEAPRRVRRLVVRDAVDVLGVRYVVEGSRLGARLLLEQAAGLGCDERCGARFLAGEAGSLSDWQDVLRELNSTSLGAAETARAVEASSSTFALAEDCLYDDRDD